MNKQLLINTISFEFVKDNLFEEAIRSDGKRLVVKGILQRAGIKNQNGRVYPKDVLIRESKKFEENFIKERRALGELDHPECVSCCDIMTYDGWKDIKKVKIGDKITTLNIKNRNIEYNSIERIINEPYKGKLISIKGENIDILVTPNHRFIIEDRNGDYIEKTAQEILDISKNTKFPYWSILKELELKSIHLDFRFIKIEEVDYDDRVYCVTVKNGTFYCRNNTKCFWSGNSSVVNLQNVSHNIIEMHWEGDDLIGTVEILTTPNGNILKELFKANIRLGISSRGLGTVNKSMNEDADVVQDDFELIAFDFVSNPSTRGAFMFPSGNLQEGVKNIVKNPITNKWEVVENIIRDILTEIG